MVPSLLLSVLLQTTSDRFVSQLLQNTRTTCHLSQFSWLSYMEYSKKKIKIKKMELVYDSRVQVLLHTLKAIKFQYLYKYYTTTNFHFSIDSRHSCFMRGTHINIAINILLQKKLNKSLSQLTRHWDLLDNCRFTIKLARWMRGVWYIALIDTDVGFGSIKYVDTERCWNSGLLCLLPSCDSAVPSRRIQAAVSESVTAERTRPVVWSRCGNESSVKRIVSLQHWGGFYKRCMKLENRLSKQHRL